MSVRGTQPDSPRAIFAGDADREMERLRAADDPRVQRAPREASAPTAIPPATPSTDHGDAAEALRARIANINGRDRAKQQQEPDPGHVVADIARTDGTVVRVAVKRYQPEGPQQRGDGGAVYVDLRVWTGAWPVKGKGVALRPRELARIAAALLDAADVITRERGSR